MCCLQVEDEEEDEDGGGGGGPPSWIKDGARVVCKSTKRIGTLRLRAGSGDTAIPGTKALVLFDSHAGLNNVAQVHDVLRLRPVSDAPLGVHADDGTRKMRTCRQLGRAAVAKAATQGAKRHCR